MNSSHPSPTQNQDSNDPVFRQEQIKLTETYGQLVSLRDDLIAELKKLVEEAARSKTDMSEELTLNFATDDDILETYADFESLNRIIDAYNLSIENISERLLKLQALLKKPYFAKILLAFKPNEDEKTFYIGTAGMVDQQYRRLIVDWRSPLAEVYYNQSMGFTSYRAHGRTIECNLKLRRQFSITRDVLHNYFDTSVAIQDSLLLASLKERRSDQLRAITATIQKEQNQIIRHKDVAALLVNGIAGSGKTSVLLQRIAYLFYQERDTLKADQLVLVSPNAVFSRYIDQVLPDLGERNPQIITWRQFSKTHLPNGFVASAPSCSLDDLRRIDLALGDFRFSTQDFRDIKIDGRRFFTARQIQTIVNKFNRIPSPSQRIVLTCEELERRFERQLRKLSNDEDMQALVSQLSPDEQVKLFGELPDMNDEVALTAATLTYVQNRYRRGFEIIDHRDWVRAGHIGSRLKGTPDLSSEELLYLKIRLTGLQETAVRYLLVDEVQDYTIPQLLVLANFYPRAHFMGIGDENQVLTDEGSTFAELTAGLQSFYQTIDQCLLLTSYRSTSEITDLFSPLAKNYADMEIVSVQRDNTPPVIEECNDEKLYHQKLIDTIKAASKQSEQGGLVALIAQDDDELAGLVRFTQENFSEHDGIILHHLQQARTLPHSGIVILTINEAKGLEFDWVICSDASQSRYPKTDLARRQIYTMLSRATQKLTILSKGSLTAWLRH